MRILALALLSAAVFLLILAPAQGQRDLSGAAQIATELERLNVLGSVLMIAAHPDDENTALLAYLARGRKVRTAYLSATRGEGGQNLIGLRTGRPVGRDPHAGASLRPPDRWGRAVLHPRRRLRIHQDARGDARKMGPRAHSLRHGVDHPPLPARRHHPAVFRHAARRPWPASDVGDSRQGSLRRRRR